jgi:phosphohistidine phosphatase
MRLVIVRHAIAEDREEFAATGQDDGLRPLTPDGIKKMTQGVRGLRTLVPSIDVLAASPLTRALQTAEIIQNAYAVDRVETVPALAPERAVSEVTSWLSSTSGDVVTVVGHEPQLGRLISYFLGAGDQPAVELKKGGASFLEFADKPQPGGARLIWAVPPRVLRDLAG